MQNQSPPSISTCLQLMEEYSMLPNIREHSFVVAMVAERIVERLARENPGVETPAKELVVAGALLHDIAKTKCLQEGGDHASMGAEICLGHGYPAIAEIVREHVRLFNFTEERYRQGLFQAKEIIFYADKRVVHSDIVGLERRLEYILEHYGKNDARRHQLIRKNFKRCQLLEEWLCMKANSSPAELVNEAAV